MCVVFYRDFSVDVLWRDVLTHAPTCIGIQCRAGADTGSGPGGSVSRAGALDATVGAGSEHNDGTRGATVGRTDGAEG